MRRNIVVLISTLWLWLIGSCLASRFVVEKENLQVISPESLQGAYECSIERFSIPPYGGSLVGTVSYPKANQKACRSFTNFGPFFKTRVGGLPKIFLVDRGDCFFGLKVYNAQKAGAAAVLIVDDIDEPLIVMDNPEEKGGFNIPSAFISKSLGERIKESLNRGDLVTINLVFNSPREVALPPKEQVKYELWVSGNLGCGANCQDQLEFMKNFGEVAKIFEERGYTQFTPHYVTWYYPEAFLSSKQCKSQCIYQCRCCAPDPQEEDLFRGCHKGKDIVVQSLIQACFYQVAKESGKPWLWWDYVTQFASQCTMRSGNYGLSFCGDRIIQLLGVDRKKVYECLGNNEADEEHPVLKAEQEAQIGKLGPGRDVTIVPALVIDNKYYRGKLVKDDVLKAICDGIREEVKPEICPKEEMSKTESINENFVTIDHIDSQEEIEGLEVNNIPVEIHLGSYESTKIATEDKIQTIEKGSHDDMELVPIYVKKTDNLSSKEDHQEKEETGIFHSTFASNKELAKKVEPAYYYAWDWDKSASTEMEKSDKGEGQYLEFNNFPPLIGEEAKTS